MEISLDPQRRKLTRSEMCEMLRDIDFVKWATDLNDKAEEAVRSGKYREIIDGRQKLITSGRQLG